MNECNKGQNDLPFAGSVWPNILNMMHQNDLYCLPVGQFVQFSMDLFISGPHNPTNHKVKPMQPPFTVACLFEYNYLAMTLTLRIS